MGRLGTLLFVFALAGCGTTSPEPAVKRPASWARPIERAGLPNLHMVSPALYRGAQPEREGYAELEKLGVRTVVSLRDWHSDRSGIRGTSLAYERVGMSAWSPKTAEYARVLAIIRDQSRQPVFVHCKHGADRTGTLCALYRVIVQGWSREDAVAEMTGGGYGFHESFDGLLEFVRTVKREDLDPPNVDQAVAVRHLATAWRRRRPTALPMRTAADMGAPDGPRDFAFQSRVHTMHGVGNRR